MSPKFPCATPGVLELPHSLFVSKVWGVCNWLSQWWLIFGLLQVDATRYSGWCYSIKMIFCVFFFLSFFFFFCLLLAFWGHWWITGQDVLMWKGLLPLLMLRCILITGVPLYQGFLFWCMMGICCLRLYMVGFSYMAFVTGSVLWTICKHKKNPRFYIWIGSLLRNHFGKQVTLRMFLAENLNKIEPIYFHLFMFLW